MKTSLITVLTYLHPKAFLIVCFISATFVAAPLKGDVIIFAEYVSAQPGSTGNALDVMLKNTGLVSVTIGGFSFEVSTASSGIAFTSASIDTAAPYVFAGNSLFGPNIETATGQSLTASDLYDVVFSGATVSSNQIVGLGRVFFDVSGSVFGGGPFPVDIPVVLSAYSFTSLSDPNGIDIPFDTLLDGSIRIVPEPASFGLVAATFLAYAGIRRVRKTFPVSQNKRVSSVSIEA